MECVLEATYNISYEKKKDFLIEQHPMKKPMILRRLGFDDSECKKRNLISMCLFGEKDMYLNGAVQNAKLSKIVYPDWNIRFYVDENVSNGVVESLLREKAQVIIYRSLPGRAGQLMRFLPLADHKGEIVIVRDCDSRLNLRERVAVREFEQSKDKRFHLMYEHMHPKDTVFGGMFGVRGVIPRIRDEIEKCLNDGDACEKYGDDMLFLDRVLLPMMSDSNTMKHGEGKDAEKMLPYRDKVYQGYVGQVILCNCPYGLYAGKGCGHATRKVPCSVATLVHSSPNILLNLGKFLG